MPATRLTDGVLSWAGDLDEGTVQQARNTAQVPAVTGHVALMPDAHLGYGATVGSVIPTEGAIIPSAVGVDIGCGMVAVETDLDASDLSDDLRPLLSRVEEAIPAGVGQGHDHARVGAAWLDEQPDTPELVRTSDRQRRRAAEQFGTLGAGNHFVEVCLDEHDTVWVVLHSGSRGVGNTLAQRHIDRAKGLLKQRHESLADPDLAYVVEGTPEFREYVNDLEWAQRYAYANRERMVDLVLHELFDEVGEGREVDRVNCFAGDTPVMTPAGSVPIRALAGGEAEVLTSAGQWVKAPIESFGEQPLMRLALSRSKVTKVIYVTPRHRWFVRSRRGVVSETTTSELQPGDRLAFTFPKRAHDPALQDHWVARGFVFGDGSHQVGRTKAHANFCGEKDEAMVSFFDGLGNALRDYGASKRITGLPGPWKTDLPSLFEDVDALYSWLAGYFAADGDVDKTGRPTLASSVRENLEHVRAIGNVIGVGTFGIRMRMRKGYGEIPTPLYLVGLMRGDLTSEFFGLPEHRKRFLDGRNAVERRGWNVVSVEETDRVEEVYCAVVEDTHDFALEDNILTSNCHHNYAAREHHDGRELWITRKGAIRAREGDRGVIPGSMGASSYIVRGLGNPLAYESAAHGAGRAMSRRQAKKRFATTDLAEAMGDRTWLSDRAGKLLDEIPAAYKDIDEVMERQRDLVQVEHRLRQVLNYKGT